MTTPDAAAPPAPVEQAEIEALRATARWLVAVSGVVFATLAAGIQLSSLGRLSAYPMQLSVAAGAAILTLAVASAVLIQAVRVLVDPGLSLNRLAKQATKPGWDRSWLNDQLNGQRGMFGLGATQLDLPGIYRKFSVLRQAWATYSDSGEVTLARDLDDPTSPKITYTSADAEQLQRRVIHYETIAKQIAGAASLLTVRRRFRDLKNVLLAVCAVPVLAIPVFVYATTTPTDAVVTSPAAMIIELRSDPEAAAALAGANIPTACTGRHLVATAVGGTFSQPVVVRPGPDCPIARVQISRRLGLAYPSNPK